MPVRSLRSSVLRWPDRDLVLDAATRWAREASDAQPAVVAVGCYGSALTRRWGVGSDLDLIVVVRECDLPHERRGSLFDTTTLPVPVDLLVYTAAEFRDARASETRFAGVLRSDVRWLLGRPD